MPKAFTAGNGRILVGFDSQARVKDFYYPYVGQENHIGGDLLHRVAVRVDGNTYFLGDDFSVEMSGCQNTQAGYAVAHAPQAQLSLHFKDAVYNEKDILLRNVRIENNADHDREISLYFCHEFQISQTTDANTAYFDPRHEAIIHYRGNRAFLTNMKDGNGFFDEYTTGVFGINGNQGSYMDIYDGELSKNPIEHGPCDSCIGMTRSIPADDNHEFHYWVAVGNSISEVAALNSYVLRKTPAHLEKTTRDFWQAWSGRRTFDFDTLSDPVEELFHHSLLAIRTHVSENGAIIASADSDMLQKGKDTYSYVWPRDGAYIAGALDASGDWSISQRFFIFMRDVIDTEGYFMHKFNPDKSLGSSWHPWVREGEMQLPIQEDETGSILHALWQHYEASRDLEFIEKIYDPVIYRGAQFMLSFRDDEGLPKASYDLWEEKIGVHTYTVSSVIGGLRSAAKFAALLGKDADARLFETEAENIKAVMEENLTKNGHFIKGLKADENKTQDETADMSTLFGLLHFNVYPVHAEIVSRTAKVVFSGTSVDTEVGGFARYTGDQYYRNPEHTEVAGNPWFMTTLWHAYYHIQKADSLADLKPAEADFRWVEKHALNSGVLSEQIDPYDGHQMSAAPLVWSHAEYVRVLLRYKEKVANLNKHDNTN